MNNNWKDDFFGEMNRDGRRLTWSAVIAGLTTFMAVFLTLSLIGFTIGLTTINPMASNPLHHLGTNVTIWSIIALVLSLAAGGFISGLVANKAGALHGFMTWVIGVILLAFFVTNTVAGVVRTTDTIVSGAVNTTSKGVNLVISKSGENLDKAVKNLSGEILDIDTKKLEDEIDKALVDTDIKELQPDYLNKQLEEARSDIEAAAKNILLSPDEYKKEIENLADSLEKRTKDITDSIDKDAIANAVSKNTDLTPEEAEIAVDNIYNEYTEASIKATETIEESKMKLTSLSDGVEDVKETIKEGADTVVDAGAKGSLYMFFGLVIALFITSYAGKKGASFLD